MRPSHFGHEIVEYEDSVKVPVGLESSRVSHRVLCLEVSKVSGSKFVWVSCVGNFLGHVEIIKVLGPESPGRSDIFPLDVIGAQVSIFFFVVTVILLLVWVYCVVGGPCEGFCISGKKRESFVLIGDLGSSHYCYVDTILSHFIPMVTFCYLYNGNCKVIITVYYLLEGWEVLRKGLL